MSFEPDDFNDEQGKDTKKPATPPAAPVDEKAIVDKAAREAESRMATRMRQDQAAREIRRSVESAAEAVDPTFANQPGWIRDGATAQVLQKLSGNPKVKEMSDDEFNAEIKRVTGDVLKQVPKGATARTDEAGLESRIAATDAHGEGGPVRADVRKEAEEIDPGWGLSERRKLSTEDEILADAERDRQKFYRELAQSK